MNNEDKRLADELTAEGVARAIEERWVSFEDITDLKLRWAVMAATNAYDAFTAACWIAEAEAERVLGQ